MFYRASISLARALRIAQMLGLHKIDGDRSTMTSPLPEPQDLCELEERRRTWWVVCSHDYLVASVLGWPALVNERDVRT